MPSDSVIPSSFRDPSGFVFTHEGIVYRQVNLSYKAEYDRLMESGCYSSLVQKGWLLPHEELNNSISHTHEGYITLRPEQLPFISFPYEWSFDMLKDAALLTLSIQKECIHHGMVLKDATPYNIQWHKGKPVFIDSLSFATYDEAEPWVAYRQFCESFAAPLLLMHHKKYPLHPLFLAWPDGIPLPLTRSLLPFKTRFSLHTYLHIHLHAKMSGGNKPASGNKTARFSKQKMLNLISSLETMIAKLQLAPQKSTWSGYYDEAAQRDDYLPAKKALVQDWISKLTSIHTAIDLGANDGAFSRLLASQQIFTIAADFDPFCINHLYQAIKTEKLSGIHPLVMDLSNPSPAIGPYKGERDSFIQRTHTDLGLALALIHHLAIGKNIPFHKIAALMAAACHTLIIEFVPKADEKVKLMLQGREDIFTDYHEAAFENAFSAYFTIVEKAPVAQSGRTLYLMQKNAD
ncbi:MAG: SAM-dependent methyltransferase [Bacteroidetes bacterium]|nr:SAM-dependent methyltransferase [Bacteroidota bacterium]